MKPVFILFLALLTCARGFAQEKITDTTMVVGVLNDDTFLGNSVALYCSPGIDQYVSKGTAVIISGVQSCSSYGSIKTIYEVLYKNKTYYIENDKLYTKEAYYTQILAMSAEQQEAFRASAKKYSEAIASTQKTKLLKFLDATAPKGLAILKWSFYDESEYTSGTSVKVEVYNPTKKTIKYLHFTFVGFNAVNDKIVDRRKGTSTIQTRAIGPIAPGETGSYNWEYVWFTDLVETARITSVKVQYMDGTTKVIAAPKEIILSGDLYDATLGN